MNSLIFYYKESAHGLEYSRLWTGTEHAGYVRAEKVPLGVSEALDAATPREGETVLNTISLDPPMVTCRNLLCHHFVETPGDLCPRCEDSEQGDKEAAWDAKREAKEKAE